VLVGRVVGHEIDQQPDAATVAGRQQAVEAAQVAELRVDVAEVGDVVAEVGLGRGEERRDPDGVDPQPRQVVEVGLDARQVARRTAAARGEGARVDLVEDGGSPPGNGHGGRC
jgi:hypothetical protein